MRRVRVDLISCVSTHHSYRTCLFQRRSPTIIPPDSEAIETKPDLWLDLYGDILFRDAMVRLSDRAAAADAVQEALLAALRGVREGRFDGRVEFRRWLRSILRNKAIDQIRRRARERPFDTSDPDGIEDKLLFKLTGLPTASPDNWAFDLNTAFEREDFWAAFEECMSTLSDAQRSLFTMKVLDGVATEEVCKILGINANHMGVLLHRARQALKNCLESKWFVQEEQPK